jgi:hypothetical protein
LAHHAKAMIKLSLNAITRAEALFTSSIVKIATAIKDKACHHLSRH